MKPWVALFVVSIFAVCVSAQDNKFPLTIKVMEAAAMPYKADNPFSTTGGTITRVLNGARVKALDGNTYDISCTVTNHWSKCANLIAGQEYRARITKKGLMEIEHLTTYRILGSAAAE